MNSSEKAPIQTGNQENGGLVSRWDLLNPENDARWHAKQAKEVEFSFAKRLDDLNRSGMSLEEFEKWEDAFTDEYNPARAKAYEGYKDYEKFCDIMEETVAYPGSGREPDLRRTIEARAGLYFPARRRALMNAIGTSDRSSEQKKADQNVLRDFAEAVYTHMDWKNKSREKLASIGFKEADSLRTLAHNRVIKTLNKLNGIAESYGVRPFTPRDFLPSDAVPKNEQTKSESTIMRYDRDIVEEYYAYAFPAAAKEDEKKWKAYEKYGIYE